MCLRDISNEDPENLSEDDCDDDEENNMRSGRKFKLNNDQAVDSSDAFNNDINETLKNKLKVIVKENEEDSGEDEEEEQKQSYIPKRKGLINNVE